MNWMKELTWKNWMKELIDMKKLNELTWTVWHEWMTWMKWHEQIDMKEFKWMIWHEWIDMNGLKWMNWQEGIDMNDLKWKNGNEGIETNKLKRRNWKEWIDIIDLKWMNELTWKNWDERIEMHELKGMNCQKRTEPLSFYRLLCEIKLSLQSCAHFADHIFKSGLNLSVFWNVYVKSSSRYSLVQIWSASSSRVSNTFCRLHLPKVIRARLFLTFFLWNRAPCAFGRRHLPKVVWGCQFFTILIVKSSSRSSLVHIFSTSSKSGPSRSVFNDFYKCDQRLDADVVDIWNQALATVPCTLRPHYLRKVVWGCQFFTILWEVELSLRRPPLPKVVWDRRLFKVFFGNRALATVPRTFFRPHLQKVLRTCPFFTIFMWNQALTAVPCTLRPHYLRKVVWGCQLFMIFMWNRALATVPCTFCRPRLPKWSEPVRFFAVFVEKTNPLRQSRARFVDHFPRSSRAPAETETLQRRPRKAILPEKTQGFAPESVFKREFTRSRSLTLPNYLMMLWLTWWCGWHDGETACCENHS